MKVAFASLLALTTGLWFSVLSAAVNVTPNMTVEQLEAELARAATQDSESPTALASGAIGAGFGCAVVMTALVNTSQPLGPSLEALIALNCDPYELVTAAVGAGADPAAVTAVPGIAALPTTLVGEAVALGIEIRDGIPPDGLRRPGGLGIGTPSGGGSAS